MRRNPAQAVGVRTDLRRAVSAVAAVSLLAVLLPRWHDLGTGSAAGGAVVAGGFLLALLAVVAAFSVPQRQLDRVDLAVLALGTGLFLAVQSRVFAATYRGHTDEARLGQRALALLVAGRDPYTAAIPLHTGTRLVDGTVVNRYEYPPLTLEIGWLLHHLSGTLAQPWVLTTLAVVVTAAVTFTSLPSQWRALAVVVVFGFGLLSGYAADGFPVLIALPLLCVAARRWTDIGSGGRLGGPAAARAVALGLAVSAQQLAWFIAALLFVAVWVVRCGEMPRWRAAAVTGRFAAVAALTFLAANLPFLLWNAHRWLAGITTVLTQQATPFGGGLLLAAIEAVGHCDLSYLFYATEVLAGTLVLITAVGLRRIGLAVPVLAALLFVVSARSDAEYFVAFVPLWLVWAATADPAAVAAARPVCLPRGVGRVITTVPRGFLATAAALTPTAVLVALALAAPPPVSVRVFAAVPGDRSLRSLAVTVVNRSGAVLRPWFTVGPRAHAERWRVASGPVVLSPGERLTVRLVPRRPPPRTLGTWRVTAFCPQPPGFDSALLRVAPGGPRSGRRLSGIRP